MFTLTGAPVKDWHDRGGRGGEKWVQRIFWGLKFRFELIFFWSVNYTRIFLGVANIGWDFFGYFIWSSA